MAVVLFLKKQKNILKIQALCNFFGPALMPFRSLALMRSCPVLRCRLSDAVSFSRSDALCCAAFSFVRLCSLYLMQI